MDIAFKVYNARKARKIKQATVFVAKTRGNQRKEKRNDAKKYEQKGPLDKNQCASFRKERHQKNYQTKNGKWRQGEEREESGREGLEADGGAEW